MSGFLVDTHVLLWWADSANSVSEEARLALSSGRNTLFYSHASIWELHIKMSLGKLKLPGTTAELLDLARCKPLPLSIAHIEETVRLPHLHRDPFDRMLVAQARTDDLTLITRDRLIPQYDVVTLAA